MSNWENIKKNLLERKIELESNLQLLYKDKSNDDQVQDPGDQALSSSIEEIKISQHNNERLEYSRILKALEMLENGTYGICTDCGEAIMERRLMLYPNATRCIACQEAQEAE